MVDPDSNDAPVRGEFVDGLSPSEDIPIDVTVTKRIAEERDLSGETIARYRLIQLIARGGMGIVYRARDEAKSRDVALKLLPLVFSVDEERANLFLREARSASVASGPNIAAVYEVSEVEGRPYIAMELVEGRNLREARTDLLRVEDALRVALGIAEGLATAHASGVVHRDLKPDNIMIDRTGAPKILDFGLARLREPFGIAGVQGRRIVRTPWYLSPEQAKGRPVDARSDVFSFGVVLYELLSGQRPFAGATPLEVLIAIDRDAPKPLHRIAPKVPRKLVELVDRCLQKDPSARPPDGTALVEALRKVSAAPPERSRLLLVALVILALVVCAAALRLLGKL